MRSRNPVYPLPQGAFPVHINGEQNHVLIPEWKLGWTGKKVSPSALLGPHIPDLTKARQDLPLPDSSIGAFEPSLYGMIIHAVLTLVTYVK